MKLLADARTLGSRPSGVGIYLYNFIRAILATSDTDIVLVSDVAESTQIQELLDIGGGKIKIRLSGRSVEKSAGVFGYFGFVQKVIYSEKPDIFWEPNNIFPVPLKNPHGRIVVTVHDVLPMTFPECYMRIYPLYFKLAMKNTLRRSDGILYDSAVSKEETEEFFKGAKGKKSIIAYAVVKTDGLSADKDELSEGLSDNGYFLYIGNLERRKGTDILLSAYDRYRASGGDKKLVLAGKIREDGIRTAIDKGNAVYLGYVSDERKAALMSHCSALVFPTRAEGFGIPIIEALSCEKPVIASDLPIVREIAPECCRLFKMSDDENESTKALSEALAEELSPPDNAKTADVLARYGDRRLAGALLTFFSGLAGNG